MPRTTLNIESPVFRDLKRLQKKEKVPLGTLVSQLLMDALERRKQNKPVSPSFQWKSKAMGQPRVNLEDKQAVYQLLDEAITTTKKMTSR